MTTIWDGFVNYLSDHKLNDDIKLIYCDGSDLNEVKEKWKIVNVVIITVGFNYEDKGEWIPSTTGGDRIHLELKNSDENIIQTIAPINKNSIVILQGGSAVITESWRNSITSMLMIWYFGMKGRKALAEIVFGDVNPSAKLPLPFPASSSTSLFLEC